LVVAESLPPQEHAHAALPSVTRLSGPVPDPWLCVPASQRVCLYREEGSALTHHCRVCPIGTSAGKLDIVWAWLHRVVRQASSRAHRPVRLWRPGTGGVRPASRPVPPARAPVRRGHGGKWGQRIRMCVGSGLAWPHAAAILGFLARPRRCALPGARSPVPSRGQS